jgi:hypothetical protein
MKMFLGSKENLGTKENLEQKSGRIVQGVLKERIE